VAAGAGGPLGTIVKLVVAEVDAVPLVTWTVTVNVPGEEYVCEFVAGPGSNANALSPQFHR
jgi:hypothetical protein